MRSTLITLAVAAAFVLLGCASEVPQQPGPALRLPAERVDLPDTLGTPVAIVAPEFPKAAISEGEHARFVIQFEVNLRGNVVASEIVESTHKDLDEDLLRQHRNWVYAVATRSERCAVTLFRGLQTILVERRDGKLKAALEPAQVIERISQRAYKDAKEASSPNYRDEMSRIKYPEAARIRGLQARVTLIAEFGVEGTVVDLYPVNAAYDHWGFTAAAMTAARRIKVDNPGATRLIVCIPVDFHMR